MEYAVVFSFLLALLVAEGQGRDCFACQHVEYEGSDALKLLVNLDTTDNNCEHDPSSTWVKTCSSENLGCFKSVVEYDITSIGGVLGSGKVKQTRRTCGRLASGWDGPTCNDNPSANKIRRPFTDSIAYTATRTTARQCVCDTDQCNSGTLATATVFGVLLPVAIMKMLF